MISSWYAAANQMQVCCGLFQMWFRWDFIQPLDWDIDMDIIFTWVLTRDRPKGKEVVKYEKTVNPLDLPKQSRVEDCFRNPQVLFFLFCYHQINVELVYWNKLVKILFVDLMLYYSISVVCFSYKCNEVLMNKIVTQVFTTIPY